MKGSLYFISICLAAFLVACGPSDEDKARAKLNFAKVLLEKQDTTAALLHLDSISLLFPKAPYSINAAKNMMTEINFELLHRKETALDTIKSRIAELENSFVKEKTEFNRYTQYIHKRQTLQRSLIRSFIQIHLDERGDLYLSSNYHGKSSINHYGIRVYDAEISAKTDSVPVGDANNHQSDFMEYKWEKVSYRNGKDNGVIEFIANHADRKLKAVFLGKGQFYIILEEYDKVAVKDALALSKAIKRKNNLEKEIQSLQKKLQIN
ncbi:MAG: hypothetical protein EP310_09570 [Bacteroidetes bacterium]|nr:MAG: hypothetical protein EP310_09570 [Bacteroidota bacterium]